MPTGSPPPANSAAQRVASQPTSTPTDAAVRSESSTLQNANPPWQRRAAELTTRLRDTNENTKPEPRSDSSRPKPTYASDKELVKPRWVPSAEPNQKPRWLGVMSRTSVLVWVLAAVVIVQAAAIVLWLGPFSSGASASAAGMGSMVVTSEPPNAAVLIDDVPRGLTPLTLSLAAGVHHVAVGSEGTMRQKSVTLAAGGEASVHFEMAPGPAPSLANAPTATTGTLNINTDPPGAQVFVDNVRRGVAPVAVNSLSAGAHVVTVRDSRRSISQPVRVAAGTASTVMISMSARSEFESGSLSIKTPVPLQIRERGTLLGSSEASSLLLPTGRHTLELTNADLNFRAERTVEIQAGRTASVELTLPNGVLHLNAIPWAEVWIGTRALGETPIANATVPIGTHQLVFRHPELGERRESVVVRVGAPARVGVDLRKGQ